MFRRFLKVKITSADLWCSDRIYCCRVLYVPFDRARARLIKAGCYGFIGGLYSSLLDHGHLFYSFLLVILPLAKKKKKLSIEGVGSIQQAISAMIEEHACLRLDRRIGNEPISRSLNVLALFYLKPGRAILNYDNCLLCFGVHGLIAFASGEFIVVVVQGRFFNRGKENIIIVERTYEL